MRFQNGLGFLAVGANVDLASDGGGDESRAVFAKLVALLLGRVSQPGELAEFAAKLLDNSPLHFVWREGDLNISDLLEVKVL